jgi:uncharacterized protein
LRVDPEAGLEIRDDRVTATGRLIAVGDQPWPYVGSRAALSGETIPVPMVPYHQWANCGPSTMRVWLPTIEDDS